jgi:hypothetical protein
LSSSGLSPALRLRRVRHRWHPLPVSDASSLLFLGGVVDEPDWVSWRWVVGLGGALLVLGAWLFGFGDPVWMSVPMLLALVVPRLRDGSGVPISVAVLSVQNLPALAVLVLVVRDALVAGELSAPVAVLAPVAILVAALGHGLWVGGQRGPVAGVGVVLAGWCAALVISGQLSPLDEGYYVRRPWWRPPWWASRWRGRSSARRAAKNAGSGP